MISKNHIEKAKRSDLPGILQRMGESLIPEGNGYHFRDHDSLKLFQKNGIWLYKWWAKGGEVGDGIDYLQRYHGMDFNEAVKVLIGSHNHSNKIKGGKHTHNYSKHEDRSEDYKTSQWQQKSKRLIRVAQSNLFLPNGKERISYLKHERGLRLDTILQYHLGLASAKG